MKDTATASTNSNVENLTINGFWRRCITSIIIHSRNYFQHMQLIEKMDEQLELALQRWNEMLLTWLLSILPTVVILISRLSQGYLQYSSTF